MSALAAVILLRSAYAPGPIIAALFLSSAAIPELRVGFGLIARLVLPDTVAGWIARAIVAAAFFTALAAAIRFSQLFPRAISPVEIQGGHPPSGRLGHSTAIVWGGAVVLTVTSLLVFGGIGPTASLIPTILASLLVLRNFTVGYLMGTPSDREKILWLAAGILATTLVLLLVWRFSQ